MVRQQAHGQSLGGPSELVEVEGQHPGGRVSWRVIGVAKEVNSGQSEHTVPSCSEGYSFPD